MSFPILVARVMGAARLLERMMRGKRVSARLYEIEPLGLATRQSTDVVALADRQIASAVRFIRENAGRGIGVEDILKVAPMSRTLLERKFRKLLGRAPYEEILRVRLRRAKELLLDTDISVAEVADRLGFSSPEYLSAAFKQHVGLSPRQFRAKHLG